MKVVWTRNFTYFVKLHRRSVKGGKRRVLLVTVSKYYISERYSSQTFLW